MQLCFKVELINLRYMREFYVLSTYYSNDHISAILAMVLKYN